MNNAELSDAQLSRYSRHILLPEFDLAGQIKLQQASALIIGAGGLGSPAALYLASSGIGQLSIIDDDDVDLGNLQRQISYKNNDIGNPKAARLRDNLLAINPEIEVTAINKRADKALIQEYATQSDVILDCSDNFTTRFDTNQASLTTKTPLISGAAIRFQGQISVFDPRHNEAPCYQCLYRDIADSPGETCHDRGIFAPLVGIIGSMQAAEAIKLLIGIGQSLIGQLFTIDTLNMTPRLIKLPKDPHCPACSAPRQA